MSEKTSERQSSKIHLKQARLKRYYTIRDTKIEFEPDLNIIIGKNGVGKSNFLRYLKTSIDFNIQSISDHDTHLVFSTNKTSEIAVSTTSKIEIKENRTPLKNIVTFGVSKDKSPQEIFHEYPDLYNFLNREKFFPYAVFIGHGLPVEYHLVASPLSFTINEKGVLENYNELLSGEIRRHCKFLENLVNFIFYKGIKLYSENKPGKKDIENMIREISTLLEPVETALKKFTDINGVRLNKNYNLVFNKTKSQFSVTNLFLEFKIDKQWLPFSHLSDGIRRLFYIVSEVAFPPLFYFQQDGLELNTGGGNKIVLIEEPELGLHPHQLDGLLCLLRESSQEHQIIVTTHAPQVLDILNRQELNKIVIARLTGKGTQLRHLTEKEQEKARLYLEEEAYLSDYWKYSDLDD